jgi:hypothetical protein
MTEIIKDSESANNVALQERDKSNNLAETLEIDNPKEVNTLDLVAVMTGTPWFLENYKLLESYEKQYYAVAEKVYAKFPDLEGLSNDEKKDKLQEMFPEVARFALWVREYSNKAEIHIWDIRKQRDFIRETGENSYSLPKTLKLQK